MLTQRAKCQRTKSKNWAFHAKAEESVVSARDIGVRYLFRPFQMLFQEPIFLLLTLHVGFIYGFLYIFLEAYPISLQYDRGWQEVVAALAFVAIICGVAVACLIILIFSLTRYRSILCRAGRVDTEERLILMIIGCPGAHRNVLVCLDIKSSHHLDSTGHIRRLLGGRGVC